METLITNSIIHNLSVVVNNNSPEDVNEVHASCSYDRFRKFADKKSAAVKIANKLFMIGEAKRGALMKACNSVMEIYTCKCCGKARIVNAHLCRDRLCPTCQYLLSVKRYNQMQSTIAAIKNIDSYDWRFITFTIRNCTPDELSPTIRTMLGAWDKVCKRRTIKRRLFGWGRSLEITYNQNTGTFHPHIHFIAAFEKGSAPDLLEVSQWWQSALELSYLPVCDIEIPYSKKDDTITGAMVEAFKYCTKSKELVDMPLSAFAELVSALKGVRLLAFGGIVRKARASIGIIENDVAEQVVLENAECCNQSMQRAIAKWSFNTNNFEIIERCSNKC